MDFNGHELFEEILADPLFPKWARGKAPELDQYWEEWVGGNEQRREMLSVAKGVIQTMGSARLPISDDHILEKVKMAVRAQEQNLTNHKIFSPFRKQIVAAAAVLLAFVLGWGLYSNWPSGLTHDMAESDIHPEFKYTDLVSVRNTDKEARFLQLPDGSNIILQENAEIRYPIRFSDGKREVFLSGEAFFEVAHNPASPFYVHANQAVTKVLGTSFKVKALPETRLIHVAVKTGKVAVFTEAERISGALKDATEGNFLKHNEEAVFEVVAHKLKRKEDLKARLAPMPIEKLSFRYDATPVNEVFQELQAAYGVKIIFDEKQLRNCSITAHLGEEALIQKIEWICTIMEASYKQEGNHITIDAKPCI